MKEVAAAALEPNGKAMKRPGPGISFRPVERGDFVRIIRWRREPHVAEWFANAIDFEEAERRYGPRVDGKSPTKMHVIEIDGNPVGYLQHYLVRDYPEYLAAIKDDEPAAIDFLIGETAYVGRGLGPLVIRRYVEQVVMAEHPGVQRVVSTPDPRNARSIRALEKAGFHAGPVIDVEGNDERLCVFSVS